MIREREYSSIQDSIDAPIQQIEDYIKKRGGRLITVTRNNTDNASINRTKINRKKNGKKTNVSIFQATNKSHTRKLGHG